MRWISRSPRVLLFDNFASKKECEYLMNVSKQRLMQKSTIENHKLSKLRKAEQTWFPRGDTLPLWAEEYKGEPVSMIDTLEKRIADATFIPQVCVGIDCTLIGVLSLIHTCVCWY